MFTIDSQTVDTARIIGAYLIGLISMYILIWAFSPDKKYEDVPVMNTHEDLEHIDVALRDNTYTKP